MSAFWIKLRKFWKAAVGARARPDTCGAPGNSELGVAGERAAEAHLRANGLRVLVRNWRNPADEREEIDLVCEEPAGPGDVAAALVFVEVKARAAGARVAGYHAVNRRKKAVLLRACRAYLARLRPPARHVRFDIVEVTHGADATRVAAMEAMRLDPKVASVREGRQVWHYRDVPLFPDRASHNHDRHR
jgi:putative endonuclease